MIKRIRTYSSTELSEEHLARGLVFRKRVLVGRLDETFCD